MHNAWLRDVKRFVFSCKCAIMHDELKNSELSKRYM